MKCEYLIAAALFAACCGPTRADSTVSYAIDPSRFDIVAMVSIDGEHDSPFLSDGLDGGWDMIVCNQSGVEGGGTVNGQNFSVHAHNCKPIAGVKSIQLNHNTNAPWHGTVYARWH